MADSITPTSTPSKAASLTPNAQPATATPQPAASTPTPSASTSSTLPEKPSPTPTPAVSPAPVEEKHTSPITKVVIVAFIVVDLVLLGYILYRSGMLPIS